MHLLNQNLHADVLHCPILYFSLEMRLDLYDRSVRHLGRSLPIVPPLPNPPLCLLLLLHLEMPPDVPDVPPLFNLNRTMHPDPPLCLLLPLHLEMPPDLPDVPPLSNPNLEMLPDLYDRSRRLHCRSLPDVPPLYNLNREM